MIHQIQHKNNAKYQNKDTDRKECNTSEPLNRQLNTSVANLDDYIYELENRSQSKLNHNSDKESPNRAMGESDENLLSQLQQKEKDLILAAELGKALLDRNEELSRANEKITEEYSHKLEVIIVFIIFSINNQIIDSIVHKISAKI